LNSQPQPIAISGEGGPSIQQLSEIFAMKKEPDCTITRIEELEKLVADLTSNVDKDRSDNNSR